MIENIDHRKNFEQNLKNIKVEDKEFYDRQPQQNALALLNDINNQLKTIEISIQGRLDIEEKARAPEKRKLMEKMKEMWYGPEVALYKKQDVIHIIQDKIAEISGYNERGDIPSESIRARLIATEKQFLEKMNSVKTEKELQILQKETEQTLKNIENALEAWREKHK